MLVPKGSVSYKIMFWFLKLYLVLLVDYDELVWPDLLAADKWQFELVDAGYC